MVAFRVPGQGLCLELWPVGSSAGGLLSVPTGSPAWTLQPRSLQLQISALIFPVLGLLPVSLCPYTRTDQAQGTGHVVALIIARVPPSQVNISASPRERES